MDNSVRIPDQTNKNRNYSQIQSVEQGLAEIDRTLHQMLLLAELSAGDGKVDRQSLQKALERLRDRIDRISDRL